MFRRRGGVRGALRRIMGGGSPLVPPALKRAHALMQSGNYVEAAGQFEFLAYGAEVRFPQRAPHLFLQAGRARILNGDTDVGMTHLLRGLRMLISGGQIATAQRIGARISQELTARGLTDQAQEIINLTGARVSPSAPPGAPSGGRLPTHCPACGGPLRPDEIEWFDEISVACPYCGSPVQAE